MEKFVIISFAKRVRLYQNLKFFYSYARTVRKILAVVYREMYKIIMEPYFLRYLDEGDCILKYGFYFLLTVFLKEFSLF